MSVAKTLQSIIKTVSPMFIHFLMETYGFRGMLGILAAINFHAIFGMIVMHPVEWHSKEIKILIDESESCNSFSQSFSFDRISNDFNTIGWIVDIFFLL